MIERFADTCKYCGLSKEAGHAIKSVADGLGYVMRLVGPDGHLFEQVVFPRAPQPVVVSSQRYRETSFRVKGEEDMTVIDRVKALDVNRASADEMIDLLTSARLVRGTYVEKSLPVPEPLTDGVRRLELEIEAHRKDTLERRRKEISAQMVGLESVTDKRTRLQREAEEIDAALGVKTDAPTSA